jgi:hypothetical protein
MAFSVSYLFVQSHNVVDFSEATADPAFVLITSVWYTRQQQPTIIGYWYSANGIGIAVGGLLGYGIGNARVAFLSFPDPRLNLYLRSKVPFRPGDTNFW